jgi:WG containing repeat
MNVGRIFQIASFLFLFSAVSCVFLALRLPHSGVRIPVHCANGKIGYIDRSGRMVISPVWDSATPFGLDDRALVSITKKPGRIESLFLRWSLKSFGFPRTLHYKIDRQGNRTAIDPPLANPWHNETEPIRSGEMTLIEKGGEFRWILQDSSSAFVGSWQQAKDFRKDNPAAVLENRRWGFINRRGEKIIPCSWDDTLGFDGNGSACVLIDRKWGVIDPDGHLVVPLRFKSLTGFDDAGFSAAELASGWGFIDRKGKVLIPFRYNAADSFDRFGMARIQLNVDRVNSLSGWIDRSGKSVIEPRYEAESPVWAPNFANHPLLPVISSGKAGLIDRKGVSVVAHAHGELTPAVDPVAPNTFWITTLPYRSVHSPNGQTRPPFQPACYDSSGTIIWNGHTLTKAEIQAIFAAVSGLMSALLFVAAKRVTS